MALEESAVPGGGPGRRRSRPEIDPSYGVATGEDGMLQWDWAVERLAGALMYWLATTRPDGRPHVKPVWGVWVAGTLFLETGPVSRAGRNLAVNPAVAVHVERGDDVVILEGVAEPATADSNRLAAQIADAFGAKYGDKGYQPQPDQYLQPNSGLYRVRPHVAFAWADFLRDATRWRFLEE